MMRSSRIQTVWLFLFTIFLISGIARPRIAESLTSYIDEYNRFILNGAPFFPIGLYVAQCSNGSYINELDTIADSPFDTLMNDSINRCGIDATPEQIGDYLDALQTLPRDLKLIFSLVRVEEGPALDGRPLGLSTIEDKVKTFKDHQAIISWYNNEEVDPQYLAELEAAYNKIRSLDDNHPVWSVHWDYTWVLPEAHTTDIVGVETYPIDNNPITLVRIWADGANEAGKPLWLAPQIFDWTDYRNDVAGRDLTGRPPTWEDMRAMTYLAINHGAKGLIYYSYYDIVDEPDYDTRWSDIKDIAGEIDQLRPVFLSIYRTGSNQVTCNKDVIDFKLMWELVDKKYYLFAVNAKAPSKIIVDDLDAEYQGGGWILESEGYNNTVHSHAAGDGTAKATWTPNITEAGNYRVYARWTAGADRATNAQYTINYDGGFEQVRVNQNLQTNDDRWILLGTGTYPFAAGTSGSVELSDDADGVVIADAIMWLLKEGDVTSASFQINLAQKPNSVDTWFEGGITIPVSGGEFTDSFNPYEVHVYDWGGDFEEDADFTADQTSGTQPFDVQFTDQSTWTTETTWAWNFGDGGTSTEQNPLYTYNNAGDFNVSLTVTSLSWGTDTETKTGYIHVEPAPWTPSGSSSSGDGCFIATAAFGSYLDPSVQVIKDFRDEYLLTNMPGRCFVSMYNTYGPFCADLLNAHPWCKPCVRLALIPVVGISYFVLNTSLATKLLTGFLLIGFIVICLLRIHGRSATNE